MEEREKICRLCLNNCDNNFTVVEKESTDFVSFLLKNNLSVNEGALICVNCTKSIKDCSNFKSTCLDVEDFILQYHKDSNAKLDLKKANDILEDHVVCRLCMGYLRVHSIVSLDNKAGDVVLEEIMLKKCFPELDLRVTEKPVICVPCRESLQHYFGFITNCVIVEEKIKKYCEAAGVDDTGLIKLKDIREFITKPVFVKVDEIKVEDKFCEDEENVDEVKYSEELPCTSENELSKEEVREVKFQVEEIFHEEIDCKIEVKSENLRKMEEQQFENDDDQNRLNRFEVSVDSSQPVVTTRLHRKRECLNPNLEDLSSKRPMLRHKNSSEATYNFDFSLYRTKIKNLLKQHHKLKHSDPSEVEMYKCDFCSYRTKTKNFLIQHYVLKHNNPSGVEMYKCKFCIYQSNCKGNLDKHLLKHMDPLEITMYECESCSYKSKYKSTLNRHLLRKHGYLL